MSILALAIQLLFVVLFIATLVMFLRRRDALNRDVMLIFASLAGLFVFSGARALGLRLPDPVTGGFLALLLAQPLFVLQLAARLGRVRPLVRILAALLWAATALPMIVVPISEVPVLAAAAIVVFALTHFVGAAYLAREARRRVGSARTRLSAAAAAGFVVALAIAIAILLSGIEGGSEVGSVLVLAAAALYLFAFLLPARLRLVGNALTTFEFTEHLLGSSFAEGAEGVWTRLADLGRRTTGAAAAIALIGEPPATVGFSTRDESAQASLSGLRLTTMPTPMHERRPAQGDAGGLGSVARAIGATYVSVLPFELVGGEPGALVLLREHPSLFDVDEEAILRSLIDRARIFAERSEALREEAALAQRLTATVAALEQASQAKSDFLASMSHELRTPLSAIIGFAALMRDEPLAGDRRAVPDEWIEHIRRSGDHLLALINDVLDLTKIEAGRIDLDRAPFELASALAESVEGLRPLADRKNIDVRADVEPGRINADRGRLRQVVYNLLSNAIKFTPEGGRVTVEGRWSGPDVTIAVIDSGVGIAEGDLGRVFEEFSQVGDMKAREAGTGLGLALSRRLVQAHGGEIRVTSTPGAGSRFEVSLPESRAEAADVVVEASQPASTTGSTVLVIEDDPGAVRLLRAYLEGEGYEVDVATDGEAGIAAARASSPGAIILDVLLPGIDGWEVLRRLKADAELRDIPVMVATVVDERNVAMNLGAVDYFLKPVRPDALLARLSTYTFTTKVKQRHVRVLVIDDDPTALDLVAGALRPEGFEVITAASGAEGLALAHEHPPDLVICDLVMPEMDGFEVVNRLAESEMPSDVPILILTGQDLTTADRGRLNGKVADIMEKDGDPRPALGRWLRRAAAASQRRSPAPVA